MGNSKQIFSSDDELLHTIARTYGHPFKEYDVNHRLENPDNKGQLGHIVEEGILGYDINSDPDEDIANLGVEVKVSGVVMNQNGTLKAKERLTIDNLNYNKIVSCEFEESPMWHKADKMLLVFYRYLEGQEYGDMPIIKAAINEFDPIDIEIMKRDYEYIRGMIQNGKADDISEGDTMFLAACTAGTGALVAQPCSEHKAKQRKFCLKQSYFSQLVRKYVSNSEYEHILSLDEIRNASFEISLKTILSSFYGKSETELRHLLAIEDNPTAKNRYERYLAGMLGIKGIISETDEFQKAGIQVKTIRVQENGRIKESMSFPYFEFTDIYRQNWEDSDLRNMFANTKYMFVVFRERNGELYFDRVKFWHMKETELDQKVRPVFEKLKKIIASGNIVSDVTKNAAGKLIRHTNFPGMSDNPIVHVRPHARDANDTCDLPVRDRLTGATSFTKQCFWLNSSYVESIIRDEQD